MENAQFAQLIEEATSHELKQANLDLNQKIVQLINTRVGLPKEAVKLLKLRMLKKHPKI